MTTSTALLPTPALRPGRPPAPTATALIVAGHALTAWGERLATHRDTVDRRLLALHSEARRDAQAAAHAGLFR